MFPAGVINTVARALAHYSRAADRLKLSGRALGISSTIFWLTQLSAYSIMDLWLRQTSLLS
jgi:hypothetical protein